MELLQKKLSQFEKANVKLKFSVNLKTQSNSTTAIYSGMCLYLNSIICSFLHVYCKTTYPHHFLYPHRFQDRIPELMSVMVKEPQLKTEDMMLLYSIIANSTMILKDFHHAEEFLHRALDCEASLNGFAKPTFTLACAYCHLSYVCICFDKLQEAYLFARKSIEFCSALNMNESDLMSEAILKIAHIENQYYNRIQYFYQMGKREHLTDRVSKIIFFFINN